MRTVDSNRDILSGPYRDVVNIEPRQGPRGGITWWLTLSCGYFVIRKPKKATRITRAVFRDPEFAPQRCMCRSCK